jgi:hypothetical protein
MIYGELERTVRSLKTFSAVAWRTGETVKMISQNSHSYEEIISQM